MYGLSITWLTRTAIRGAILRMVESTKHPLETNLNKNNILGSPGNQRESTSNVFDRGFPFQESSPITRMLSNFEEFNINDENIAPNSSHIKQLDAKSEVASLKAELDATRRRLAEYETSRSKDMLQTPAGPPKCHNIRNNDVYSSTTPSIDFVHKDILPWSDYNSSFLDVPTQPPPAPHPSAFDYTAPVPPLRLPSTSAPFQDNHGIYTNTGLPTFYVRLLTLGNYVLRDGHRNFSLPTPAPIGEPRKVSPIQRSFSAEVKNLQDKEAWRPEPDWSTPWSALPTGNSTRQLMGNSSHSVVFNDQQPSLDVFSSISPS
jgi:hypothetical protein